MTSSEQPDPTSEGGRKSSNTNPKTVPSSSTDQQDTRPVPVWTSNQRTVQVPQRFLRALGIETPACRSELASDVLILGINWLNTDVRLVEEIAEWGSNPKTVSFTYSRAMVDKLPDFIVEANNTMLYRALLQIKQLKNKMRIRALSSAAPPPKIQPPETKDIPATAPAPDELQQLYIGLYALLAFKINIIQTREEMMEKFSATNEEVNRVQEDIQLMQCDSATAISPPIDTYIQVENSMDTEGKASSGLMNLEIDDQFSGHGSARIRPAKPIPKSSSLMSMNRDKDGGSNGTGTSVAT